jgi:hypothetical protein
LRQMGASEPDTYFLKASGNGRIRLVACNN